MKSRIFLSVIVVLMVLFYSCGKKPNAPIELRCEFQKDPIVIDAEQPRFSWKLNDTARGISQSAYQILVATELNLLSESKSDIWNSGKVKSNESQLVKFQGDRLRSGKKYFWKVKIWDQNRKESAYSEAADYEMGLLREKDWKASWIGQKKVPISKTSEYLGNWIWSSPIAKTDQQIFFRKNFYLREKPVKEAVLRLTADNQFAVYLNGRYIAKASSWYQFYYHELSPFLKGGDNTLSFSVENGNDQTAGLIYSLHIYFEDGSEQVILSDETTLLKLKQPDDRWKEIEYDDDEWLNAKIVAPYSGGFWGDSIRLIEPRKSVLLRKEFKIENPIESAKIYVTGLGGYVLSINGKRIGNDLLTPGWTHYPKKIQYQVYDITENIKTGKNAVGAKLGNVWWSSGLGWNGGAFYGTGELRLLAQLAIHYKDGTSEVISTDETWKTAPSPIIYNTLYHGEIYDARLKQKEWDSPNFNDEGWNNVTLFEDFNPKKVAQYSPSIQVTEELMATFITEPMPDVYVYDFGQNMVGRGRLKISGKKGQKITMRFAELLHEDGTVAQENLRMAKATDVYICKGKGVEEWAPDFVYHGFRYVQVEGLEGKPNKGSLTGEVFHNNAEFIGEFKSSNKMLNQIWKNITWGQRGNMMSVPTDCPQRDERLGWMGDAQIFAPTASYNMHMPNFWSKWVADIVDCQDPEGWVYDVNPAIVVDGPSKPGWGDAVIITPWMNYLFYGDKKVLEDNYEGMKSWIEYMRNNSKDYIYEWGNSEWGGYGDWVAVEPSPSKPIGCAYYYYSTSLFVKVSKILGRDREVKEFAALLPKIANAYQKKYFNASTLQYEGETQTANLLPLAMGITPDSLKDAVFENLVENVNNHGKHLTTGFLGTAYLLPELSKNNQHDLAFEVATQETYPSWGYMVNNGATTMWELWNSNNERPEGMNSRNHFAYGSIGEWFFGYLAGIQPIEEHPGFKKVRIAPHVPKNLVSAGAAYESPYGTIESYWEKNENALELSITIPANSTAEVLLPMVGYGMITENGNTLFENGKTFEFGNIIFKGRKNESLVFDVGSGKYVFHVK